MYGFMNIRMNEGDEGEDDDDDESLWQGSVAIRYESRQLPH